MFHATDNWIPDQVGNDRRNGTRNYSWNADNQLISCDSVQYQYDESGRRYLKIYNGTTTEYVYDGLDPLMEIKNGQVEKIYTTSGGVLGQIISVRNQETDYYYHYDAIGNVIFITDSSGQIIAEYSQEGFGNIIASGGTAQNNYHLTTKEYDSDIGLYYFGARWYDPQIGRWISREPLGLDGPNLYHFTFNNPVNGFDANGLWNSIWHYVHGFSAGFKSSSGGIMKKTVSGTIAGIREAATDIGTGGTSPQDANLHAMGGVIGYTKSGKPKYQSKKQTKDCTGKLINSMDPSDPRRMHAIIDSYAPAHDYDYWDGNLTIGHFSSDLFNPLMNLSNLEAILSGTDKLNE